MKRTLGLIAITSAVIALAGCASTGTGTPASAPSSEPSAAPSTAPVAAAPSAEPSTGPCTTRACIVYDAKSMVGTVAKDESVLTKMSCFKRTVKHAAPGVWTVRCDATYSDGAEYAGIASVLISQDKVTWEPTGVVSYGSGG